MSQNDDFYRLVLVDDEDEVRGRISSRITESSGFRVAGAASNGYDALELIEEFSPHAVITDIKMPYIGGIELADIIKREYPSIRVAFITGYDEFDYAREAVKLGVRSYLTKPLTQDDIQTFLGSLKTELDEEFRKNRDRRTLEEEFKKSLPLLIDSYFSALLSSSAQPGSDEITALLRHGIDLEHDEFVLIQIEAEEKEENVFQQEEIKLQIRSSVKDLLNRRGHSFHHFFYSTGIIFLIRQSGKKNAAELDEALMEAVQTSRLYHFTKIDIGVSSPFRGFDALRSACLEAKQALAESHFLSRGRIAYISELAAAPPRVVTMSEKERRDLEYAMKFGAEAELKKLCAQIKESLRQSGQSPADYRLFTLNLLNIALNFVSSGRGSGSGMDGIDYGGIIDTVLNLTDPDDFFDWFIGFTVDLRHSNQQNSLKNSQMLLDNAISYMKKYYTDPMLSLERTCEHAGISVSYLSLLFKKNTGQTFVKYLTSLRMEKARELLLYSGLRIIEIAEQCGYSDVYYFSHSFKKQIGMSPKRYREQNSADRIQ